ncbi:MAG: sigma-70 family RNA polymerase sigma factor [Myxococcales bacterium]|nr:sigma-70 family RNA polymerase sigma factor [Myxococcales bacterium]
MGAQKQDEATFRYISMANAIPALTREQELSLARDYLERGDAKAKHQVIQANLRHVIPHALRHRHYGLPLGELIAQGNLALVAALDRFEPQRELRFATYANHWIRAEILALVLKQRSMVGGGKGPLRAKFVFKLRRELSALLGHLGDRDAALRILAERFGKTPQELADILTRIDSRDASLDVRVGEGSGASLVELMPSDGAATDDVVAAGEARQQVGAAVRDATSDLGERERYILERRLMADPEARMSLVQIGRHFGVSRERARQLESALKQKLRKRLSPVAGELATLAAA